MAGKEMYGVVLWSDDTERKAVIWCEDHGNLAYYTQADANPVQDLKLDAGDLIQFDMSEVRQMRFARNPKLVGHDQYPELAAQLERAKALVSTTVACTHEASNNNVIEVSMRRRA